MLFALASVEKTTTAVRQLLIQSAGDFLDIAQVAERLHVSERTLRRRLEAESTSFRSTFEEIRDLLAREDLAKTDGKVAERCIYYTTDAAGRSPRDSSRGSPYR